MASKVKRGDLAPCRKIALVQHLLCLQMSDAVKVLRIFRSRYVAWAVIQILVHSRSLVSVVVQVYQYIIDMSVQIIS